MRTPKREFVGGIQAVIALRLYSTWAPLYIALTYVFDLIDPRGASALRAQVSLPRRGRSVAVRRVLRWSYTTGLSMSSRLPLPALFPSPSENHRRGRKSRQSVFAAARHGLQDPDSVTSESTMLIFNLVNYY